MLAFKINAFIHLYILTFLVLIYFNISQTTSFPLLPLFKYYFFSEIVCVILPWHHSHRIWNYLSSLLNWRAQRAGCRAGKAQLRLTAVFAVVPSPLSLQRSRQMSFTRLHSTQFGMNSTLWGFDSLSQLNTTCWSKSIRGSSCFCQGSDVACRAFTQCFILILSGTSTHPFSQLLFKSEYSEVFSGFLQLSMSSVLLPEVEARLRILSTWSLYQNLLSFHWSSLFEVDNFPYFFLGLEKFW